MGNASTTVRPGAVAALLSGLQAGMVGVLCMLAWLGVSAAWGRLTFWTSENLMATAFYGAGALRRGFSMHSISGLALYLLIYSALGALFALAVRNRFSRGRTVLVGMLFGLAWYYLSYRLFWKSLLPLAALLHPERQTILGHALYGAMVGRFGAYLEPTGEASEAPSEIAAGNESGSGSEAG